MEEVKKTKKKNKVASLLLALALILTCGVAGTIAQYQKSLGGQSTATVAKFDVSAGSTQTDQFNLFENIYDTKSSSGAAEKETDVATGKIAPGTQGFLPLELTNKSEVTVNYTVTAALTASTGELTGTYANGTTDQTVYSKNQIPLKFAVTTTDPTKDNFASVTTWYDLTQMSQLNAAIGQTGNQLSAPTSPKTEEKTTIYICWQWAFGVDGANDAANKLDTAIGLAMANRGKSSSDLSKDTENGTLTFTDPKLDLTVKFTQEN